MGCDIHIVLERKLPNREWIGLWTSDEFPPNGVGRGNRPMIAQRDYGFFAEVAAVRGRSDTSKYPQNIPEDVSRLAWAQYMQAPTDHHSASHLSAEEFVAAYLRVNPESDRHRPAHALYDLLGIDADYPEGAEYRVVFWFDN